ncbi:hypothetical protein GP475_00720 [Corynebacterium poyangense]|uniref:Uncharacterized protein n=1 Tax=Corynebacterium poyangense TaxID=2684405 RepID=A0A7H0SL92_9CORY|nr:hypothetical protein [Corynebacterium poyangense]MBZ8177407.1 hypothetical protein [Corynebacterium poyangense]QNQ89317.1 hypothetical protein GP475_00720 [Corynebacterium poyangense]
MSLSSGILRGITGAYLLQSGWSLKDLPEEAAKGLQDFAATGVPQMKKLSPAQFRQFVAYSQLGIGGALLAPVVPKKLAALGLAGFSAGLLSIYFRNQDMTQADGIRPSEAGLSLSKDVWLAAIAGALLVDKS